MRSVNTRGIRVSVASLAIGSAVIVQFAGGALSYVSQMSIARWLHANQFGIFSAATSVATLLSLAATLGSTGVALRIVPPQIRAREFQEARRIVGSTLSLCILGGSLAGLAAGAVAWTRGAGISFALAVVMLVVSLTVGSAGSSLGRSVGRSVSTLAVGVVVRPVLVLGLVSGSLALGIPGESGAGLWVASGAAAAAAGMQMVLIGRSVVGFASLRPQAPSRDFVRRGPAFLVMTGLATLMGQVDLLVVAATRPAAETGYYAAASRLAMSTALITAAVQSVVIPRISATRAEDGPTALTKISRQAARWATAGSLPIGIVLMGAPGLVLSLYGDDFRVAGLALAGITAGQLINTACGPSTVVLLFQDQERSAIVTVAAFVVLNGLGTGVGAHLGGLTGAGLASGAMLAVTGVATALVARRVSGVITVV